MIKGHGQVYWQLFYHTKEIVLSKINFENSFFMDIYFKNEIWLARQHFQHKLQSLLVNYFALQNSKLYNFIYSDMQNFSLASYFFLTLILTRIFFATLFFFHAVTLYGYVSRTDRIPLLWCCFLYVKEATSPHLS